MKVMQVTQVTQTAECRLARPASARNGEVRHRVHDLVVDAKLKVNMRASRQTGRTFEPDHLAPHHTVPDACVRLEKVAIQRRDAPAVGYDDVVAIADRRVADGD